MPSTRRWPRNLLRRDGTGPGFDEGPALTVCLDATGLTVSHHLPTGLLETGDLEALRGELRLIACYGLLNQLPQDGVLEALGSLSDMVQFYRSRSGSRPQLAATTQVTAKVRSTSTRPDFTLDAEE